MAAKLAPGLSETLPHKRQFDTCQGCGGRAEKTWQEQGRAMAFVRLCVACSRELIPRHPRLYTEKAWGQAAPGAMRCCRDCTHHKDLRCSSPLLPIKGGIYLPIAEHWVSSPKWRDIKDADFTAEPACSGHTPIQKT